MIQLKNTLNLPQNISRKTLNTEIRKNRGLSVSIRKERKRDSESIVHEIIFPRNNLFVSKKNTHNNCNRFLCFCKFVIKSNTLHKHTETVTSQVFLGPDSEKREESRSPINELNRLRTEH